MKCSTDFEDSNSKQEESRIQEKHTKQHEETKIPQNWMQRLKFGIVLAVAFCFILYLGSLALAANILLVQVMCYKEIIHIVYMINSGPKLPRFRTTAWYFFTIWNYCLLGETFGEQYKNVFNDDLYLSFIFSHSRFKGFCLYFIGIVIFVLSLAGKYDTRRFRMLAILHVLLIVIILPSYLLTKCALQGIIWAVVPLISVALNDIFAYLFGKLMGKTPLIHLSPNKTWEGFIGAAIGTIFSTVLFSSVLCKFKYFICPTEYNANSHMIEINTNCTSMFLFENADYELFLGVSIQILPFIIVSFYIAVFASLVAPFAGFFASGFKRAFNVKDFSDTIPGHGGILDRFDCQFLMACFVFVYMSTFVKYNKFKKMHEKIMNLNIDDQLIFYDLLRVSLEERNIL